MTNFDKGNKIMLNKFEDDVMSENCDLIAIF